jgi:hypothetical protein
MGPPPEPGDPRIDNLAAIDEILQVMYWLRGERLAQAVGAADLSRWVGLSAQEIAPLLARMAAAGWIQPVAGEASETPRYELTGSGAREGGRRFADEFADLTRPGHGECADPNCECQRTGDPADCTHRHV